MEGFNAWEAMARQVAPDLYEKNHYLLKFYQSLCWIRVGEQENCLASHQMPIAGCIVCGEVLRGHSQACLGALPGGFVSEVALQYCQHDLGSGSYGPCGLTGIAGSVGADVNALSGGTVLDDFKAD